MKNDTSGNGDDGSGGNRSGDLPDRGDVRRLDGGTPHVDGPTLVALAEALRPGISRGWERCVQGIAKHGVYEPLPVAERLEKIARHLAKYKTGLRNEDHLAAILSNAAFAMRAETDISNQHQ